MDEHSHNQQEQETFLDFQMKGFSLIHYNEYKASLRQFIECQTFDYFDADNWLNIGNSFLPQLISHSKSNDNNKSSLSQVQSKSIFNSQRSNLLLKEDLTLIKKNSKFEIKSGANTLLVKIEQSNVFRDFLLEKQISEDSMQGLSCLRRLIVIDQGLLFGSVQLENIL